MPPRLFFILAVIGGSSLHYTGGEERCRSRSFVFQCTIYRPNRAGPRSFQASSSRKWWRLCYRRTIQKNMIDSDRDVLLLFSLVLTHPLVRKAINQHLVKLIYLHI